MKELGVLKEIDPRQIRPDEARDFTPWLRERISQLNEALGLGIEVLGVEEKVGVFAADLVGTDVPTGRGVVIENQLGKSAHDHLGKAITYAGNRKNTQIVVWIATEFRPEHQQALEWANSQTADPVALYGVQLKVLQIDDSRPAVDFRVAAGPEPGPPPPPPGRYVTFFEDLLGRLKRSYPGMTTAKRVGRYSWFAISAGRTGFGYAFAFTKGGGFRVELYVDVGDRATNKAYFDALQKQDDEIHRIADQRLTWERLDDKRACRIAAHYGKPVTIDASENDLEELKQWALKTVVPFTQAFSSRISALDAGAPANESQEQ